MCIHYQGHTFFFIILNLQFKLKLKLNNLQHGGCLNQFIINIPYFIVNI